MFNLFKKREPPDPRDLEQIIYDIAENKIDRDFHILYERMSNRHVFVPVDPTTVPVEATEGKKYVTTSTDRLRMRTVIGPNNLVLVPCATNEESMLLKDGYLGMDWFDFLEMFMKLDTSFYGVVLQGKTSWVVFDRDRTKYILSLRSANK